MARIEVLPAALDSTGASQSALAGRVYELAGRLEATGSNAAGAAGEPEAGAVMSDACASWAVSLAMLADSVGGLAGNLQAAASAYTATDTTAMPGGP